MTRAQIVNGMAAKGYEIKVYTEGDSKKVIFQGKYGLPYKLGNSYSLEWSDWEIKEDLAHRLLKWAGYTIKECLEVSY